MLIRIVRMTFKPEEIDSFLAVFEASKDKIRNFEGCQYLELMQDANQSNVLITFSKWDNEAHLNSYRFSELFKSTWAKTKPLFEAPPVAFSMNSLILV